MDRTLAIYSPELIEHKIQTWAGRQIREAVRKSTSINAVPMQRMEHRDELPEESFKEFAQIIKAGRAIFAIMVVIVSTDCTEVWSPAKRRVQRP